MCRTIQQEQTQTNVGHRASYYRSLETIKSSGVYGAWYTCIQSYCRLICSVRPRSHVFNVGRDSDDVIRMAGSLLTFRLDGPVLQSEPESGFCKSTARRLAIARP